MREQGGHNMLDGTDADLTFAQDGAKTGIDDLVVQRGNGEAQIGAIEKNSAAGGAGGQAAHDPPAGMQSDSDEANARTQSPPSAST